MYYFGKKDTISMQSKKTFEAPQIIDKIRLPAKYWTKPLSIPCLPCRYSRSITESVCQYSINTKNVHKLDNSKLGSTQHMLTLTCCQDHILTENIWFVWSKTSYSGDKRRCHYAGRTDKRTSEDRATQPMEAGGWVSQKVFEIGFQRIFKIWSFETQ